MGSRLEAEGDLRAVDAVDPRVAARRAAPGRDYVARHKAQFHEPAGDVFGEVETVENGLLAFLELDERGGGR